MEGVKFAKFRVSKDRDFVKEKFNATTFPTIVGVENGKVTKYESENRTVSALKKFIKALE